MKPYVIEIGDCLEVLRTMPDCSVDSVVTDPPYGLTNNSGGSSGKGANTPPYSRAKAGATKGGFMGLKWDSAVPSVDVWAECLRVLKPCGHLMAFAATRTQHRMAVRIEDAGFEIRDLIAWVHSSGFPKSRNLEGVWNGWGTALKPAIEPITVARKPLQGTVADNVLAHGTGALNIDGCRVLVDGEQRAPITGKGGLPTRHNQHEVREAGIVTQPHVLGRWPANLIHSGEPEVLACFPDSTGSGTARTLKRGQRFEGSGWGMGGGEVSLRDAGTGSAARFFYCAKACKQDRDEGLEGFAKTSGGFVSNTSGQHMTRRGEGYQVAPRANNHPTVKPTALMRYLCRLVTPPGGLVLDPYMGSGSTGKAAVLEGFRFIGIEREPQYVAIAEARLNAAAVQPDLFNAYDGASDEAEGVAPVWPAKATAHVAPLS
jgi:site-specific DNA-methyltransferase (adenine-specific)